MDRRDYTDNAKGVARHDQRLKVYMIEGLKREISRIKKNNLCNLIPSISEEFMKPREIFIWVAAAVLFARILFAKYLSFEIMLAVQFVIVISLIIANVDLAKEYIKTKKNEGILLLLFIFLFISSSDLASATWTRISGKLGEMITPPVLIFILFVIFIIVYRWILHLGKKTK